jgi:hypothetical protein
LWAIPVPWITNAVAGSNRVTLSWEDIGAASSCSVKRATSETGTYQTIATGLTSVSYPDLNAQNGQAYYYAVSVIIGGQESPNSSMRAGNCQLELRPLSGNPSPQVLRMPT